jgi:hypothetical protein
LTHSYRILTALTLVLLSACTATPRVDLRPYQEQEVGLVAKHWRDLADMAAEKYMSNTMGPVVKEKMPVVLYPANAGPVYIQKGASDSAFDRAFHNYLTTAFLKRGVKVSKQAHGGTVINYSAETYLYSRSSNEKTPFSYASFWSILYKLRTDFNELSTEMFQVNLIGLGLVWDYLAATNKVTDAEVVLTISVEEANAVKYKDSTEFYIERNDLPLYWSDKAPSPIRNDGGQSATPLKTVSIPVTK